MSRITIHPNKKLYRDSSHRGLSDHSVDAEEPRYEDVPTDGDHPWYGGVVNVSLSRRAIRREVSGEGEDDNVVHP